MRHAWKTDLQGRLSWFLIAYLTMLLGVLLAVHVLPAWGGEGSALRSPAHQERQIKAKRTANTVVDQPPVG
jgi:hypothetical protein